MFSTLGTRRVVTLSVLFFFSLAKEAVSMLQPGKEESGERKPSVDLSGDFR